MFDYSHDFSSLRSRYYFREPDNQPISIDDMFCSVYVDSKLPTFSYLINFYWSEVFVVGLSLCRTCFDETILTRPLIDNEKD